LITRGFRSDEAFQAISLSSILLCIGTAYQKTAPFSREKPWAFAPFMDEYLDDFAPFMDEKTAAYSALVRIC
jgi:hypothetical protein